MVFLEATSNICPAVTLFPVEKLGLCLMKAHQLFEYIFQEFNSKGKKVCSDALYLKPLTFFFKIC